MAKIVFSKGWTQVGEGKGQHRKEPEDEIKTDTICTLYKVKEGIFMLLPDSETMKSGYINQLADCMFKDTKWGSIIVLADIYKTNYPQLSSYPEDGTIPVITHNSSFLSDKDAWIRKAAGHEVAHFLFPCGGFGAALMMEAETKGVSAFKLTSLLDSHYLSAEILEAVH
jgi:hypothetical protein